MQNAFYRWGLGAAASPLLTFCRLECSHLLRLQQGGWGVSCSRGSGKKRRTQVPVSPAGRHHAQTHAAHNSEISP